MYCAVIGDLVESRKITNRNVIQTKLQDILNSINDSFTDDIVSKFTITIGDEFQGLLASPHSLLKIIDQIRNQLYPVRVRLGVGWGNLATNFDRERAIGADGPAYHAARKAVSELKLAGKKYNQPLQDIKIFFYNEKMNTSFQLVNALFSTCLYIENGWSDKQRETLSGIIYNNKTQIEIANDLRVGQSSIQRRLSSAGYETYKNARIQLNLFLPDLWELIKNE